MNIFGWCIWSLTILSGVFLIYAIKKEYTIDKKKRNLKKNITTPVEERVRELLNEKK